MAERRLLIEGLQDLQVADRDLEEQFVYGDKPRSSVKAVPRAPKPLPPSEDAAPAESQARPVPPVTEQPAAAPFMGVSRIPVGARVRTELAAALKRASLERQLKGMQPYSVQDILEDALALWLLKNGHAK